MNTCISNTITYCKDPVQNTLKEAKIGPYCISKPIHSKEVLSTWRKMINSYKSAPKQNKYLLSSIRLGPPIQYRWLAWKSLVNPSVSDYESLPLCSESALSSIQKDLDRTFPNELYFDREQFGCIGQATLRRILAKLAGKYTDIGYCQGMNFVSGFLLIISGGKETETFGFMESLITNYNLRGLFRPEMPYLKQSLWVFTRLLGREMPVLSAHLDKNEVLPEIWALKWFLTLFTAIFRPSLAARVWDFFLVDKMYALHKFALALMKMFEEQLLKLETAALLEFFKDVNDRIHDEDGFVQAALECPVSYADVRHLEKLYSFNSAVTIQLEQCGFAF